MLQTAICAKIKAESGVDLVQVIDEYKLNIFEKYQSISALIQLHSTNVTMVYDFGFDKQIFINVVRIKLNWAIE